MNCQGLCVYTQWTSVSDNMGVIMAVSKSDSGPSQWHFPEDLVKDQDTLNMLKALLDNVGSCDLTACLQWRFARMKFRHGIKRK